MGWCVRDERERGRERNSGSKENGSSEFKEQNHLL